MNDRFKFRIWDKENKCMHYPSRYSNFNIVNGVIVKIDSYLTGNGVYRGKRVAYEFDDAILMQSTGLKDKDEKLIYEGDIVRFQKNHNDYIAQVKWDNSCGFFYTECLGGIEISPLGEEYLRFANNIQDFIECEPEKCAVIGNVHENKELLNENS